MEKPKILIIDDDPEAVELLEENLEEDFTVISSTSSEEGIHLYDSSIECVVLDYCLEKMTGVEVFDILNKKLIRPCILATGYGSEKLSIQEFSKFFSVLTKPISYTDLIQTIHQAIFQYRSLSRERLTAETILDNTLEAIFIFGGKGKILSWNKTAEAYLGYSFSEILNKKISYLAKHPVEFDYALEVLKKRDTYSQEVIFLHKEGQEVPTLFSAKALVIHGEKKGYVASVLNISELKQTQKKLSDSEARLTAISEISTRVLEYLPTAIAVFDQSQNIISCNSAFLRTFKLSIAELSFVTSDIESIFNQEQIDHLLKALQGEPGIYEGKIMSDSSDSRWHRERFDPLSGGHNKIIGAIMIDEDITHQYELQQRLSRREKMGAIETLAGGISHEYNNLLTSIFGMSEMILRSKPSERVSTYANKIIQTAQRASQLTNQLLNFVGSQALSLAPLNIGKVVQEVLEGYQDQSENGSNIFWKFTQGPGVEKALIDRNLFEESLLAILLNAEHSVIQSPRKEIRVKIFLEKENVVVSVHDSGTGISPENLNKVFEPFFTTKGALAGGQIQGTGLGLSIANTIIEKHKGYITVHSKEGEGSEFRVHLPCRF